MESSLELERAFSLFQCNKILSFMGMDYKDLYEESEKSALLRRNLYREKTNVFAYYILSALFINNYFEFLNWCNINNSTNQLCLKFKNTDDTHKSFVDYISRQYKCNELLKGLEDMNQLHSKIVKNSTKNDQLLLTTTRMTLFG